MPWELIEDAGGDPRNAQALAAACELAYLPADAGQAAFQEQFGMTGQLVSVNNTQAYVVGNDQHLVVAFRGSESPTSIDGLKDWLLTNAANLLVLPEGDIGTDFAAAGVGARFHKGFMMALADVWPALLPAVEAELKRHDRPLWVTGHSLGGALALLASWRFFRKFVPVHQIYTFGAPMVGNAAATAAFDKEFAGKIFRYVHLNDVVPKLPMMSLIANDYGHCEKELDVGEGVPGQTAVDCIKDFVGRAVDGLFSASLMDAVWQAATQRLAAHDIANYRNLVTKR